MKSKTADSKMRYPHISQPFSRNITLSRSVSQLLYRFGSSSASNSRSRTLPSRRSPSAQSWEILSLNPFSSRPKSSDQVRVTRHPEVKWRPVSELPTTLYACDCEPDTAAILYGRHLPETNTSIILLTSGKKSPEWTLSSDVSVARLLGSDESLTAKGAEP